MTKFRSMLESCIEFAAGQSFNLVVVIEEEESGGKETETEADPINRNSALNLSTHSKTLLLELITT